MRIISRKALRLFGQRHPEAHAVLEAWYQDARQAHWQTPNDVKHVYRNASLIGRNRVVFNIKGNHYRLVVAINYTREIVYVRFIGTHQEYDKIDAAMV